MCCVCLSVYVRGVYGVCGMCVCQCVCVCVIIYPLTSLILLNPPSGVCVGEVRQWGKEGEWWVCVAE